MPRSRRKSKTRTASRRSKNVRRCRTTRPKRNKSRKVSRRLYRSRDLLSLPADLGITSDFTVDIEYNQLCGSDGHCRRWWRFVIPETLRRPTLPDLTKLNEQWKSLKTWQQHMEAMKYVQDNTKIHWEYTFEKEKGDVIAYRGFEDLEKDTVQAIVNLFYERPTYKIKSFTPQITSENGGEKKHGTIQVTFTLTSAALAR